MPEAWSESKDLLIAELTVASGPRQLPQVHREGQRHSFGVLLTACLDH